MRRVVAIAGGAAKFDAIHAALGARLAHVLITDQRTARELAARTPQPARSTVD